MNETQEAIVGRLQKYEREQGDISKAIEEQTKRRQLLDVLISEMRTLLPRNERAMPVIQPQLLTVTPLEFVGKSIPWIMEELLRRKGGEAHFDELVRLALDGGYDGSGGDADKIRINISSVVSSDEKDGGDDQKFRRIGRGVIDLVNRGK